MADISVQDMTDEDGAAVTFVAASGGGDKFVHHARAAIVIKNDDAASKTVTVTPYQTSINDRDKGELTRDAIALTVAAGAIGIIPPLPDAFSWATDSHKVRLTYSAVTNLSVGVIKL